MFTYLVPPALRRPFLLFTSFYAPLLCATLQSKLALHTWKIKKECSSSTGTEKQAPTTRFLILSNTVALLVGLLLARSLASSFGSLWALPLKAAVLGRKPKPLLHFGQASGQRLKWSKQERKIAVQIEWTRNSNQGMGLEQGCECEGIRA